MANTLRKVKADIVKTITTNDRNNASIIIDELSKSRDTIEEICNRYNMEYQRFCHIVSKPKMALEFQNALDIQKRLNSNEMLNKTLKAWDELISGDAVEERETWVINSGGTKTLQNIVKTKKAPSFQAVERALKTLAPAKFSDKLKPEQLYSIFIAFNKFLINECGGADLVNGMMNYQKEFIMKLNNE
jgi:hypothetical protein